MRFATRFLMAALPCLAVPAMAEAQVPQDVQRVLTDPVVPQGFGVNIHFTDPQPGEMERFAEGGYGLARMDFHWGGVERRRGEYDYSAFDRLVKHLNEAGAYPLFILDYGNRLYDDGQAPHTDEGREAFARYAAAAAAHYKGQPILWEIWNEPNLDGFWKPQAKVEDYAKLANLTVRAIKQADPNAVVLAPASSGFPWEYLETLFASGILEHIDAVSVHPYRGSAPETATADYVRLRGLIARYAPEGRALLPIVSGEWGYSTAVPHVDLMISEEQQARYLAREFLSNVANGVNVSIFYDWKDDGPDPNEREHRFGTVRQDLSPKPSFESAKALIGALRGHSFRHRLAATEQYDWRLLFQQGDSDALVVAEWSSDPKAPEADQMPRYRVVDAASPEFEGLRRLASVRLAAGAVPEWRDRVASLAITVVNPGNEAVAVGVAVGPESLEGQPGDAQVIVAAPGETSGQIALQAAPGAAADARPVELRLSWGGEALPAIAPVTVVRVDPVRLTVAPRGDDQLAVIVENPARAPITGAVVVGSQRVAELNNASEARLVLAVPAAAQRPVAVQVVDADGRVLAMGEASRTEAFPAGAEELRSVLHVENHGQEGVAVQEVATGEDPAAPSPTAIALPYRFDPGWRYITLQPSREIRVPEDAVALSVWIQPDDSGNALRSRIVDSTGQTFQLDLGVLRGRDWRPVRISLTGTASAPGSYWGGANDGVVHPPVTIQSLLLIDSTHREDTRIGEVLLAAPTFLLQSETDAR